MSINRMSRKNPLPSSTAFILIFGAIMFVGAVAGIRENTKPHHQEESHETDR